jgi:mannosyltransferase OCH1-like enzyme
MIPKKIHYCWLSGEKLPKNAVKCMETWKKALPDYEIVLWDANKFDIHTIPFVAEAYRVRQWAFSADYIRLFAVYTEGGIYMDTDVIVRKSFNDLLSYDFFSSLERDLETVAPESEYAKQLKENVNETFINKDVIRLPGFGMQSAVFGGIAGHPFLKDCMNWYKDKHYILPDGSYRETTGQLAPDIYSAIAQKYGFKYKFGLQKLSENMVILPAECFPNGTYKIDNAYAVHFCENSWNTKKSRGLLKIISILKYNKMLRKILKKPSVLTIDDVINYKE